jgi:hypothetical protein
MHQRRLRTSFRNSWIYRTGSSQFNLTPGGTFFCRNGRDLSHVHVDVFQAYFVAFLVIAGGGYPVDAGNPAELSSIPVVVPLPAGTPGSISQVGPAPLWTRGSTRVTEPATQRSKRSGFRSDGIAGPARKFEGAWRFRDWGADVSVPPDLLNSSVLDDIFDEFGSFASMVS